MGSRRSIAAAVCALVALLASAPAAEARFGAGEARDSVRIAWGYWRSLEPAVVDSRNAGCEPGSVHLEWHAVLGYAMATAELNGCDEDPPTIDLERETIHSLSDRHGCAVITHEVGHLLGYGHVSRDASLMSGSPSDGRRPPSEATWVRAWRRCESRL